MIDKCDENIRGHVFCGFLALVLMKELYARLEEKGSLCEGDELHRDFKFLGRTFYARVLHLCKWDDVRRDLQALREGKLQMNGQEYYMRTELRGTCAEVFRISGAAIPPRVRQQ